ncbi:putative polyketide synthase 26 [Convolutriloba macropyga]|uniref:putative polyketide synthase 26 n=1 Tax=Convolutriloba macropyga TaxID=536237 RepID=UPI003F522408
MTSNSWKIDTTSKVLILLALSCCALIFSNGAATYNLKSKILSPAVQLLWPHQTTVEKLPISQNTISYRANNSYGLTRSECDYFLRHSMSQPEPLMVAKDKQTLYNYLEKVKKSHPNMVYAEWGSGGSTYAALKYASYVISIENHKEWCDKMTNDKIIQCSIVVGKMQYICAVGGKTGTFGVPVDMENYHPEKYINALQTSGYEPDFVFIDGRFRVATASVSTKQSKKNSILMIHDYYNRKHYWDIEKYFTKEPNYQRKGKAVMGVFIKRPVINKTTLDMDIEKFSKIPK